MAEAKDSPEASRLFTHGCHQKASVIFLLQNMFPKGKYNTDISRNAQYIALFRSPSDRKQIGIIGERMFGKNRSSAIYERLLQRDGKTVYRGYLLVDNQANTPVDKQVLADLFGECYLYHLGVKRPVKTKHAGKHSTTRVTRKSVYIYIYIEKNGI